MTKGIEREAFEKALAGNNIHNLKVCTIFDDEKNEYFASDVCDPSEDHIVESINLSWRMWQAAKALEAKKLEGCVVVPANNTTIVAIEKMVEQQVEASGITADVFRIDGEKILNAAVEAARGGK